MLMCDGFVEVHLDYSMLPCFTYKYLRTTSRSKCQIKRFCNSFERKAEIKHFSSQNILLKKCLMRCRIAHSVIECFTSFYVKMFYS